MLTSMLTHILTFVDINIILLYMMVFPVVPVLLEVHVQTYPHCSKGKICSHLPSFSLSLSLSLSLSHTHTHTHTDKHMHTHTPFLLFVHPLWFNITSPWQPSRHLQIGRAHV